MSKNCEEIQILHEKQYGGKVGYLAKLRMQFHLLICKCCRDYTSCSDKIEQEMKTNNCSQKNRCTEEEKKRLKKNLV